MNLYTYCANNPIKFVDPSGHDAVAAASFMANNPKPTVNSASDANLAYEWNKKFKENLNAPSSANSASDAVHYKKQNDLYTAWSSIVKPATKRPLVTSPVNHLDYHNDASDAKYKAPRKDGKLHWGVDYYPSDSGIYQYGWDGTPKLVYSMSDGVVTGYIQDYYYGSSAVIINHGDFYTLYGEITTELNIGDTVSQGQNIGTMALTGDETLMLHLEIFVGGYEREPGEKSPYHVDPTYTYDLPDF